MLQAAIEEVTVLHRFFQEWLRGSSPNTDAAFQRLPQVLAPSFQIITPSGETVERPALLETLRMAHGSRGKKFRLWVDQVAGRELASGLYLVTYQEWQATESLERGRLSSAVFSIRGTDLLWQHVHETWLAEDAF